MAICPPTTKLNEFIIVIIGKMFFFHFIMTKAKHKFAPIPISFQQICMVLQYIRHHTQHAICTLLVHFFLIFQLLH